MVYLYRYKWCSCIDTCIVHGWYNITSSPKRHPGRNVIAVSLREIYKYFFINVSTVT